MARLIKRVGEQRSLWQKIKDVALTDVVVLAKGLDEGSLEQLEELLQQSGYGDLISNRVVDAIGDVSGGVRLSGGKSNDGSKA